MGVRIMTVRKLEKPKRLARVENVSIMEKLTEPWYFTHY